MDLYDAADSLMESGRIHEACPKYGESYRLDPQLGVLLHWADCLEQDGKLAAAYAAFRDAAELAQRVADSRGSFALERVRALEPRLNRLVLEPPRNLPPDVSIQLDSLNIVLGSLGVGIAVDAGEHSLRVSAPNFETLTLSITVGGEGQLQRFTIPELAPVPRPSRAPTPVPPAPSASAQPRRPQRSTDGQRWLGAGVGGAGVIALGVGAGFLGRMLHLLHARNELCPRDPCPEGTDRGHVRALESSARTARDWALGLSIGGALSVAAGAVLYFNAPSRGVALRAWQPRSAGTGAIDGLELRF